MKVLLATSKVARPMLEEVLKEVSSLVEPRIFELSVPVASMATTRLISEELGRLRSELGSYDLVIIPGLSMGSAREVEKAVGVKAVKGPRYLGDLPEMIRLLSRGFEFSPDVPADNIIQESLTNYYSSRIGHVIRSREALFTVKNVKFAMDPPPLNLLYEHMVGGNDSVAALSRKLERLKLLGYEGVVVGCGVTCEHLDSVRRSLALVRDQDLLAGIDLIYEAVHQSSLKDLLDSSDLILNVSGRSLDTVVKYLRSDQVVVVIPAGADGGVRPSRDVGGVIETLEALGIRNVIIDIVTKPPMLGFTESLLEIREVKKELKRPILFSPANVYELIDADSPGVIALLTSMGFELGASSLLVTESSVKTRNAALEVSVSRELVYRSYIKKSPPVNQGVDLLIVKDKRDLNVQPPQVSEGLTREVSEVTPLSPDPLYYLKVYVDRERELIVVDVYERSSNSLLRRYVGRGALDVGRALTREWGVSMEHALYLGYELCKAETALKLGKSYVQDEELFKIPYPPLGAGRRYPYKDT